MKQSKDLRRIRQRAARLLDGLEEPPAPEASPCVYVLTNPAWPGWCKVGSATGPAGRPAGPRLAVFNVGSPFADYKLAYVLEHEHARRVERLVLVALGRVHERAREWLKCSPDVAAAEIAAQAARA